jgi:hypothetical protein
VFCKGEIYEENALAGCSIAYAQQFVTYNQVADKDLKNLGLQACPPAEHFLQERDQDVP